jgi:hypothetical protein
MDLNNLKNALKGIGGEYELSRLLGAAGVLTYVVSAPVFTLWDVLHNNHFDVVGFCAAYPAGLGVAVGAVAGSIALKDRNVAAAIQTRDGTSAPAPPPPDNKE